MNEQDKLGPDERHHNEAPAEGEPSADPADTRAHPEAPAEGGDPDDEAEEAPRAED